MSFMSVTIFIIVIPCLTPRTFIIAVKEIRTKKVRLGIRVF